MNHYWCVTGIFNTRFLNTKLNNVPYHLFVLKFKSLGLIKIKKITALVFRNKHLHTAMGTCEETLLRVTRCENRMQTALNFSFSGNFFFILPCWLVTDIWNSDAISSSFENRGYALYWCNRHEGNILTGQNQRYSLSRMLKNFEGWKFHIIHDYVHGTNTQLCL